MSTYTKQVFDVTASTYDADRTRLIPGGDTFYRWALDLIPKDVQHIIELGAGSGLMTVLLRPGNVVLGNRAKWHFLFR